MPGIARAVIPDVPYHCTQRGNYGQEVFSDEDDYVQYLQYFEEYSDQFELQIYSYCLIQNHVHFIVSPKHERSLSLTFSQAHRRYSQFYNKKSGKKGHLWHGRFYSCALDNDHLFEAIRYVENNPVKADIVKRPEDYQWSGARAHIGKRTDALVSLSDNFELYKEIADWRKYLQEKEDDNIIKSIKINTSTGRPSGSKNFIAGIEKRLGRILSANPKGRPKKKKK